MDCAFQNIDDFKELLLADKDQLARALAHKFVTFSTGAAPLRADEPQIEAIVADCRMKGYGLRSLIHAIVQSKLFLSK